MKKFSRIGIWACHFPEEDCFWELKNWSNAGCRTVSRRVKDPGGRCNWSLPSPSTSEEAQRFCYVGIYWLGPWFWFDAHHVKCVKCRCLTLSPCYVLRLADLQTWRQAHSLTGHGHSCESQHRVYGGTLEWKHMTLTSWQRHGTKCQILEPS